MRLGSFHQLISFLGSIGCIMKRSGLREALETVCTPLIVVHMLTEKAYACAIRGHMLSAAALVITI